MLRIPGWQISPTIPPVNTRKVGRIRQDEPEAGPTPHPGELPGISGESTAPTGVTPRSILPAPIVSLLGGRRFLILGPLAWSPRRRGHGPRCRCRSARRGLL